jgi:MSHA pilin protein MshC
MAELIAIIVVVGVISAVAMSRISSGFADTRAFYDKLLSQVQYARKAAVAQRRAVFVRIDATQSRLCYSAAGACTGGDAVASPTGEVPFSIAAPSGVSVSAATFQFDGLGRYRDAAGAATSAPLVITVSGDGNLQFSVEHDTGYVRSYGARFHADRSHRPDRRRIGGPRRRAARLPDYRALQRRSAGIQAGTRDR